MSADRLHEAAKVLRQRAEAATPGAWVATFDPLGVHVENGDGKGRVVRDSGCDRIDGRGVQSARYIATMHPGVGLALADWLETAGADLWAHGPLCECGSGCLNCDGSLWQPHARRALALADLILEGAVDG